jgi:hypothetical protein
MRRNWSRQALTAPQAHKPGRPCPIVPGVIVLAIGVDIVAAIAWMRMRWR